MEIRQNISSQKLYMLYMEVKLQICFAVYIIKFLEGNNIFKIAVMQAKIYTHLHRVNRDINHITTIFYNGDESAY